MWHFPNLNDIWTISPSLMTESKSVCVVPQVLDAPFYLTLREKCDFRA